MKKCGDCRHGIHYGRVCGYGVVWPPGARTMCRCDATPEEIKAMISEARDKHGIELVAMGGLTSDTNCDREFSEKLEASRREWWGDDYDRIKGELEPKDEPPAL